MKSSGNLGIYDCMIDWVSLNGLWMSLDSFNPLGYQSHEETVTEHPPQYQYQTIETCLDLRFFPGSKVSYSPLLRSQLAVSTLSCLLSLRIDIIAVSWNVNAVGTRKTFLGTKTPFPYFSHQFLQNFASRFKAFRRLFSRFSIG